MIALEEKHMQQESPRTHWKQIVSLKQLTDELTEWESETCRLGCISLSMIRTGRESAWFCILSDLGHFPVSLQVVLNPKCHHALPVSRSHTRLGRSRHPTWHQLCHLWLENWPFVKGTLFTLGNTLTIWPLTQVTHHYSPLSPQMPASFQLFKKLAASLTFHRIVIHLDKIQQHRIVLFEAASSGYTHFVAWCLGFLLYPSNFRSPAKQTTGIWPWPLDASQRVKPSYFKINISKIPGTIFLDFCWNSERTCRHSKGNILLWKGENFINLYILQWKYSMYYILWVILTFSSYFLEISIWNFQREELFVVTNTVGWNPYLVDSDFLFPTLISH